MCVSAGFSPVIWLIPSLLPSASLSSSVPPGGIVSNAKRRDPVAVAVERFWGDATPPAE